MKSLFFISLILSGVSLCFGFTSDEIVRNNLTSEGKTRSYYLYVPKSVKPNAPAPLLVMLHGSGRNGRVLLEHWQKIAEREGIILAGPDAENPAFWSTPTDGPKFIFDLAEEVKAKYPVDARRVYLFGHSAGASFGILMSLMEANYFAASAFSAGALPPAYSSMLEEAERKIPIALFVGTEDPFFPLPVVRGTRDALAANQFTVELTEIPGLNHNYYSRSAEINGKAWEFIKKYKLENEPQYKEYRFSSQ